MILPYQLIIFDWDGTLMNSLDKVTVCFQEAAKTAKVPVPDKERIKQNIGLGLYEAMYDLYPNLDASLINKLVGYYRMHWLADENKPAEFFPGVVEGLQILQQKGYWLAVATGKSREGLNKDLTRHNLDDLFVYSRCADESRGKPHPQMLLDILDYTGLEARDCIVVGDTTFDLDMATAIDMNSIGVSYGSHSIAQLKASNPKTIVHRISQLFDLF